MTDKNQLKDYIAADYEAEHGINTFCFRKKLLALLFDDSFKYMFWWRKTRYHYLKGNKVRFRMYQLVNKHYQYKYGCEICYKTDIGKGAVITHLSGVVVFAQKIGTRPWLHSGVLIGEGHAGQGDHPIIGNSVFFGAGCKVVGNITIGDNVIIGVNAVVIHDVPSNSVIAGVSAKVIEHCDSVWG